MAIASGSDLAAALAAGIPGSINKASMTSKGAGLWQSLWKATGAPLPGVSPPAYTVGSGYVPTKASAGAFSFGNPTSPALSYLAQMRASSTVIGSLWIVDRMWACSGFSGTVLGPTSVTTPGNLPSGRDPNTGLDVEPWFEIYGSPGTTTATFTLTGTDGLGATSKTWTYTHPASAEAVGQMMPCYPGTATCLGMQQLTSLTLSASTLTAGNIGVTLLRRLVEIPMNPIYITSVLDAIGCGLPRIYDDACLQLMLMCSAATTGAIIGGILIGQK